MKKKVEGESVIISPPILFTIKGKQSSLDVNGNPITDNVNLAYAKSFSNGVYFIRTTSNGRLLNPFGDTGDAKRSQDEYAGLDPYFRKVPKSVFDYYLAFLRTRNQLYLANAESAYEAQ